MEQTYEINKQILDALSEILPLKPRLESFTLECKVREWPKITQTYYDCFENYWGSQLKTQVEIFNPNRTLEEVAKDIVNFSGLNEDLDKLIDELKVASKG